MLLIEWRQGLEKNVHSVTMFIQLLQQIDHRRTTEEKVHRVEGRKFTNRRYADDSHKFKFSNIIAEDFGSSFQRKVRKMRVHILHEEFYCCEIGKEA